MTDTTGSHVTYTALQHLRNIYRSGGLSKPDYITAAHAVHRRMHDIARDLDTTDIARIEITSAAVVAVFCSGVRMVIDPDDQRIAPVEALNFGSHEADELAMTLRLTQPGSVAFDVGANHGWWSLHVAQAYPTVMVHAFEPVPSTYSALRQNLGENGLPNVRLVHTAVGDEPGTVTIWYSAAGSGNASQRNLSGASDSVKVRVPIDTLDGYRLRWGVTPALIKIDVEGGELAVLRGGLLTLNQCRPVVCCELLRKWAAKFDWHPNGAIDFMSRLGYRCFTVAGEKLRAFGQVDDRTIETNYFFLHSRGHAKEIEELTL